MEKDEIKVEVENILKSHEERLTELLNHGFRITVTLKKNTHFEVEVTRQMNTEGRQSGIRIVHDGQADCFSSKEALLFSIKEIGCKQFFEAQRGNVIFRERPANAKDNQIKELEDKDGLWYVYLNAGITQRVNFLNIVYQKLGKNWQAERWSENQKS